MRELPLALLRLGVLALLWLFVLAALRVIRKDLFDRATPATPLPAPGQPATRAARRAARRAAATGPDRPPRPESAPKLVVTSGPLAGTTVGLTAGPVTFGRADSCTVVLSDDFVSNQHARLFPAGGGWLLEDLGSTNGTFLAERKVTDPTPVPLGAPIRLGRTVLELRR